jgi:hypothetical protein
MENSVLLGTKLVISSVLLVCLVLFGILYNLLVGQMIRKKRADGLMGMVVAFGVLVTLLAGRLMAVYVDWDVLVVFLLAFAASGTPMIAGSLLRHWHALDNQLETISQEPRHD